MPRKRRQPYELDLASERLAWLRDNAWGGAQVAMANETGVHQGSLSNVLRGKRGAGHALLEKIARHPRINKIWLFTGQGEPLAEHIVVPELGEAALPVTRERFEGLPADNPDRLERYLLPVHRSLFRVSRYWVIVDAGHPLTQHEIRHIAPGDFVLFEPDRSRWPTPLRGHPCLARRGRGRGATLEFATLDTTVIEGLTTDDVRLLGDKAHGSSIGLPEPRPREQRAVDLDTPPRVTSQPRSTKRKKEAITIVAVGIYREGGFVPSPQ